jgi:hypothetical protein
VPKNLTTASSIMCPHGGQVILVTSNTQSSAGHTPMLLQSDQHMIAGCPFVVGVVYMPCVTIQWQAPAVQVTVNGTGVLTQSSVGLCLNAAGAPQGTAIVVNTQMQVDSL